MRISGRKMYHNPGFTPLPRCWVCKGDRLVPVHRARFDLDIYHVQDPELAAYSGQQVWLQRCQECGFAQPEALPALPDYFERMYDQHWSEDWIEKEFDATYKDLAFRLVLKELAWRVPPACRRLLDVGAHVGRFLHLSQQSGWRVEGIELNPRTAAFAARRTGVPVHRINVHGFAGTGRGFDAATLIDVLEHIPDPVRTLAAVREWLSPGGWLAVKVPCGPNQLLKERLRGLFQKNYRISLAENLVHVNHFTPRALARTLRSAGFTKVSVVLGAPELPAPARPLDIRRRLSNGLRLFVFRLGQWLPGGIHSPLALNLQAYAQRPPDRLATRRRALV